MSKRASHAVQEDTSNVTDKDVRRKGTDANAS